MWNVAKLLGILSFSLLLSVAAPALRTLKWGSWLNSTIPAVEIKKNILVIPPVSVQSHCLMTEYFRHHFALSSSDMCP